MNVVPRLLNFWEEETSQNPFQIFGAFAKADLAEMRASAFFG